MTVVLGLDVASCTGAAWGDLSAKPSTWRAIAIECEGENSEEKSDDLAGALIDLLPDIKPAFVAIEMPLRSVTRFNTKRRDLTGESDSVTINPNALQLSGLAGAVVATLRQFNVPWGLIAPATWRAAYLGKGRRPGEGEDWKDLAIAIAQMQGIALPPTKRAARDAAESVGIMASWTRCTFVPARHHQAFIDLRTGRQPALELN